MEAISAEGLTKVWPGRTVLAGLSLSLAEGERAVVYGPTGSGKTTLLNVLAGLERADAGRVSLCGVLAAGNGRFLQPEERTLGVVFQKALLWPHLTARANVEFALHRLGLPRRRRIVRAEEALALFGALDLASRRPETLSGGQSQLVALARSVAAGPRILLWDEPFTGLDAATRDAVAAAARAYMEGSRTTLLAVSHHRDDALALSAGVLLLKEGRLEDAR